VDAEVVVSGAPGGLPGGVGSRVFDVRIEGQLALDDYDITAAVGPLAAAVHSFPVPLADGVLDLDFDSSADRPKLSALEIVALSSGGNYCVGAPNSVGPGAVMAWAGERSVAANDLSLVATGCPPDSKGLFVQSLQQTQVPFGNGFLCVAAPLYRLTPSTARRLRTCARSRNCPSLACRNSLSRAFTAPSTAS